MKTIENQWISIEFHCFPSIVGGRCGRTGCSHRRRTRVGGRRDRGASPANRRDTADTARTQRGRVKNRNVEVGHRSGNSKCHVSFFGNLSQSEDLRASHFEQKIVVFGDILYKTFLIWFLTLKNSQKSRSKVIFVSAELNKAWDLSANTVTGD